MEETGHFSCAEVSSVGTGDRESQRDKGWVLCLGKKMLTPATPILNINYILLDVPH